MEQVLLEMNRVFEILVPTLDSFHLEGDQAAVLTDEIDDSTTNTKISGGQHNDARDVAVGENDEQGENDMKWEDVDHTSPGIDADYYLLQGSYTTPSQSLPGTAWPLGDGGPPVSTIPGRTRGEVSQETSTCYFRGYKYARAWASSKKISYRCSHCRQGCSGTMAFFIRTMGYTAGRHHTCRNIDVAGTSLIDVTSAMKDRVDTLAIAQVTLPVRRIWEAVRGEYYGADNDHIVRGLAESQVLRRVYQARSRHFSGDFHYVTVNRENLSKPTRIIGWVHPSLINLLRYHGTMIFVDGTFRCVPPGYKQCVIFMVHDRASGLYVPVYYVLSTSRRGDSFWDMIHFVVQGTDQQLEPAEVVCDFECALIDTVQTQYPNAIVIGCRFHLKQALRRAMKRGGVRYRYDPWVLDILTVVEQNLIERAIKWVKREIRQRCDYSKAKSRGFWGYFQQTWLEQYNVSVWNVAGLNSELVARTNNPLEMFNRELNDRFPKPRPSMATFVGVIKTLSAEYVQRLTDIPRGRARRPTRKRIQLPAPINIPEDIGDDSYDDAPAVAELQSDSSSIEEGGEDEEEHVAMEGGSTLDDNTDEYDENVEEEMDIIDIVQVYGPGSSSYQLTIEVSKQVYEESSENDALFRSLADNVLRMQKRFLLLLDDWEQYSNADECFFVQLLNITVSKGGAAKN
ncbi:hypothetical protein PHMEG_00018138 [Phytophthora megakarya]|uniref:Uncharacterized protein n=1 Tax=Phytophthora megakarya TaxID=4795 RepID=A0A225VWB3_9STRA|nr:hypothetical protein PHMEG_00018138 [Phytophthora megakarya]